MISATMVLFIPLAAASQSLFPRQEGFRNQTTDDDFTTWINQANASTVRDIEFPGLHTASYPARGSSSNPYKAWLHIIGDSSEASSAVHGGLHPHEDYIYDNGTLKFEDDSWLMCMQVTRFRNTGISRDEDIQSDCGNVFPEECLDYLHDLAEDGRMCLNVTRGAVSPWEDSPCDGVLDGDHTKRVLEPYGVFHPTHVSNLSQFIPPMSGDVPERYDLFVDSVYLLAVGFAKAGDEDDSFGSEISIDEDAPTVSSQFHCMRADEFSDGSRTLEDIDDFAIGVRAPVWWTMAMGLVTTALIAGMF